MSPDIGRNSNNNTACILPLSSKWVTSATRTTGCCDRIQCQLDGLTPYLRSDITILVPLTFVLLL